MLNMKPLVARVCALAVAALLTSMLLLLWGAPLQTFEERLGALGWTVMPDSALEERITIVDIDEKSMAEVGPWPWSRQTMADLVVAIDNAGAQLQMHDIVYSDPKPGDDVFINALESSRGAILAQIPLLQSDQQVASGLLSHPVTGASCDAAGAVTQNYIASHSGFANVAKGHISPIVASDGVIRSAPAMICVNGANYPILAISALLKATNSGNWNVSVSPSESLFGPPAVLTLNSYPGLEVPLDATGNLRVSYKTSPDSYLAVSASDVLSGNFDPDMLANAWVLVGSTAFSMDDIFPTPYTGAAPGVEIQARILASLLDSAIPYTPVSGNWMLAVLCVLFAAATLTLADGKERTVAYGLPAMAIVFPLVALLLHMQILRSYDIWLGWLFPAVFGLVAASLMLLLEQSRVRLERGRAFVNLASYLPSDLAQEIAYTLPNSNVSARRCQVTLLSADLRNFSAFSEARPPEESAAVLHFFFTRATEIVESFGGRIHEFKGDGLLAVWDGQTSEVALQALQAAEQMQLTLHRDYLLDYAPAGLEPLDLGIGIEQGPALVGSIGPAHRRSHTLLGDTVTITLRIQEMTAELAQPILLGECIARQLGDRSLESQGSYLLNGLRIPHVLFALAPQARGKHAGKSEQPSLKVVTGGLK